MGGIFEGSCADLSICLATDGDWNILAWTLIATWILVQIKLMIGFRVPPFSGRQDLGGNLAVLPPLLLHFLCDVFCDFLLLGVVIEDGAAVLGSNVWTLPVQSSRIVHLVEEFDELAVGDLLGIEDDL